MKFQIWKWIHLGRNRQLIVILLMGLLLSGLFGCGKTEEYVAIAEQTDEMDDMAGTTEETEESEDVPEKQDAADIYVDVSGAVRYPGVYQLEADARVFEAIEMAGGLLEDAYTNALNQAQVLSDGQKLFVPTREEWETGTFSTSDTMSVDAWQGNEAADDGLININTADETKLCELPGVGAARAQAILQYRQEHGNFASIEEIQNVSGIKSGLFEKIKDKIKVQ
jgi:competence protein ComEA